MLMGRGGRNGAATEARTRDPRIAQMTLADAIYYDATGGAIRRDFEPEQWPAVLRRMDRLFREADANPTLEWLEYRRRQDAKRPVGTNAAVDQIVTWQASGAPLPEPPPKPSERDRAVRRALRRAERAGRPPALPRSPGAPHLHAVPDDR
ncbi:MAG TPA: hypothetical protein VFR97_10595 [Capillimicrobium sp.]|nr:hypothetical protein [Capillimicrobium sp.]